jgi:hypothetical protein
MAFSVTSCQLTIYVYDFAKSDWSNLKVLLANTRWDLCFVPGNIDETLSNWCGMFLSTVDKHIPKYCIKSVHDHPWIDKELLRQIKKKNIWAAVKHSTENRKNINFLKTA